MNPTSRTRHARLAWPALLCLALAAGAAGAVNAATPSTHLSVDGAVDHGVSDDLAALQALPSLTQTDVFQSGSGTQTHTYTGPLLWSLLNTAGITVNPAVKNDILNRIVVATGSDGYRSVLSLGELNPNFGNRQSLVADSETVGGVAQGLGADGFARVTAPGDVKGGRYVSNLVDLNVQTTRSTVGSAGGGVSTQFSVSGDVLHPMSFNLAALSALPAVQVTAGGTQYTGVSFWDLLNTTVGLALNGAVKNDVLGMYVVATGSDGYKAAFSLGELDPAFGNQPDIIAFAAGGQPLTSNGFARVVVPNDGKAGRYVSNLISLEVFHAAAAVPEPGSWALMAAGLLVLVVRRRR